MAFDVRSIEILAAVAKHRSFTAAADELGIRQASVSQRVHQLEHLVGTALIDRQSKQATEPGRIIIDRGERAARELTLAREQVADLLGLRGGRLRLGVIQMVGFLDLPNAIGDFHRDHPAIDISLTDGEADHMLTMLRSGELDLVISNVAPGEPNASGFERVILGEEPLTLVASTDGTSGNAIQALATLRDQPMASFGARSAMRNTVDGALAELGIDPRVAFETNRLNLLEGLTSRGLAWSIVPQSLALSWSAEISRWSLPVDTRRRVGLTWSVSGGLQPAPAAFRDRLQKSTARSTD